MRRLSLDQLQSFLTVVETGSFSEAGRQLNLTQSAVSQQIKELELRLGVRILDRLGKRAHPTAAGEELRKHARLLLKQSDLAMEAMHAVRDGGWSRVRIATSATLAAYVLAPLLFDLRNRYPRLEVTVDAGPVWKVLQRVVDNDADLAFVNTPACAIDPALAVDAVCKSSFMAFWPRTALGQPPPVVKPQHLVDKPFIFFTPGTLSYDVVQDWFEQGRCKPAASMEFESGLSIVALVEAGLGVSILPSEVALAAAVRGKVMVRPIERSIPTQLCVAIHRNKPRHQALRVLHAALLAVRIGRRNPRLSQRRN